MLSVESSLQTDITIYSVPFTLKRKLSKKRIDESKAVYVKWHEGTEREEETRLNPFLIKVPYKDGWSTTQPGRFTLVKETCSPSTYCTGNWVGPTFCLDGFGEQNISFIHQVSNPESSSPYRVPISATLFRY
jgi:hypothetical protein